MIIDNDLLTKQQKLNLDYLFKQNNIPFYLQECGADNDRFMTFTNHVVKPDEKIKSKDIYPIFEEILIAFCKKHNIDLSGMYRCAINITFPSLKQPQQCGIHEDHDFPHKHMIIYMDNSDGDTVLLNNNNEVTRISPDKYKIICFDSCLHYAERPTKDMRKVIVITFN